MSLYSQWTELAQMERMPAEQKTFWDVYFQAEKENYKKILGDHRHIFSGSLSQLAQDFEMDQVVFTGFLDGVNTSLKSELDIAALLPESDIALDIDFEKLYYNMLDAKAEWLYTLPEWNAILTDEERREITKDFRASGVFVNETNTGRNDPCPCGSGKKYKKCCGTK